MSYMENLIIPKGYLSKLSLRETETAIKEFKDVFETELSKALNLQRVSAPLFVRPETGLNDNLNGIERPVSFDIGTMNGTVCEIVQSLAKWKRMALKRYGFEVGEGLYTDMNAIRRDEELGNLHPMYVDQWDWEKVINKSDRNEETLKSVVKSIYGAFKNAENQIAAKFSVLPKVLPEEIKFVTTQELEDIYPDLTPKQREDAYCKEHKAVFIMKIGSMLKSGIKHDGRAPDYDDWNLNGDIVFWYEELNRAFEVSSMGIRVDEEALLNQLAVSQNEDRLNLQFHKDLVAKKLPYTIGGGIGQSRICMYFLKKIHIGEVQASIWPDDMIEACAKANINLL